MHSGELARLAGVTVRALRHYHQIGVLAEPERRGNGYRRYNVHDLIRVLRIKRLAGIGIPLERMPDLLDDAGGDSTMLLDELDAELEAQIQHLTKQRDTIALLRESNAAPDLPPELAPFLGMSVASGIAPEMAKFDRDQSVLLAHLAGEDAMPHIARFYERLAAPELAPAVTSISVRFSGLGLHSTEQDIIELVDNFMTTFAPIVAELSAAKPPIDLTAVASIFSEHTAGTLNTQQQRALEEIELQLSDPHGP
jgi:DNA-binding transcriptional MerR regulator